MRTRVPLYAKILAWFFLNLVLLSAVFAFLFNAQFSLNLDWLFASGARDRFEAVRDLIIGELNTAAPDEWHHVLNRYNNAYHVKFALFDDAGRPLMGDFAELPNDVKGRLTWWTEFGRFRGPPRPPGENRPSESTSNPPPPPSGRGPDGRPRGWRPPLRGLVRTLNPTSYWLLTSARIENLQAGDPMRVALIAQADSLSSGGLIFDYKPWLAVGAGAVVFSLLFWLPLIRGITRSVGQMTNATRQIANGRFDVRVDIDRSDELGQLGEAVNDMATRLDGFVTGQKRFLGDIAHELCSPLAKLQMALGVLEQRASDGQDKYVLSATEKAQQIASLVSELLYFSKASFGASTVRLQKVSVRSAVEQALRHESTDGVDVRVEIPEGLTVTADPELFVRALANLIRNAVRYAASQGPITLSAAPAGKHTSIIVADCGPGVPEGELSKIFDAFYRVDTSRTRDTGGVGLGLTIVKTCVESCGGSVTARNRKPHGLEVLLSLPTAVSAGSAEKPALSVAVSAPA